MDIRFASILISRRPVGFVNFAFFYNYFDPQGAGVVKRLKG
jgi:hypothetical protein